MASAARPGSAPHADAPVSGDAAPGSARHPVGTGVTEEAPPDPAHDPAPDPDRPSGPGEPAGLANTAGADTTTGAGKGTSAPAAAIAWRVAPFAAYMAFVLVVEAASMLGISSTTLATYGDFAGGLYPVKALCVGLVLAVCLPRCTELRFAKADLRGLPLAVVVGVAVFAAWLALDVPWARMGEPAPFAHEAWGDAGRPALLTIRFIGATLLVPLAEELFWRSFLLRHLQGGDFRTVPLTRFHAASFIAVTILFGLEHNLIVAGMAAGAAYNVVALRTGSVMCCVVAHAVTNGLLGLWVVATGAWTLW